jgi:anti-anti-sigma factor
MIEVKTHDDTSTIKIAGRFDFRSVRQFQDALRNPCGSWIVDLGEVDFVDSAALGLLLLLRERAGAVGGRVTVRRLRGQPREVLMMAKFDRLFTLED